MFIFPQYICEEGDCTSYGVITFEFWADDYSKELYGKHFCVRHAISHLTKHATDVSGITDHGVAPEKDVE